MKLHTSCSTLLLSDFITCQIDKDLSVLTIEGEPTPNDLKAAWFSISQEFFDLSENKQANYELTLVAEIEVINFKIITIQQCVEILEKYECKELIDILQSFGYLFPFDSDEKETYQNDLKKVLILAKALILQLNDKQAQLDIINKSNGPAVETTRQYYDKTLSVLSKFMAHQIDETKITVARYAAILNLYISHYEHLNAQKK